MMTQAPWEIAGTGDGHAGAAAPRRLFALTCVALLVAALAVGCDTGDDAGQVERPGVVRIADMDWETLWINNAIVAFIAEHGFGRQVQIVNVSTPIMQQAILQDEVDVVTEMYPQNMREWWDRVRDDGTVIDLGEIMEASYRGFYVPRYVIEGDDARGIDPIAPELRMFEDLRDHAHVFPDPEAPDKGQVISCIIGWICLDTNQVLFAAHGFDDHFNMLEPGSNAAMDAAIVRAYQRGEPVLFYYWEPTWLIADLDLIKLEHAEPFTLECERARNEMAAGERPIGPEAGCAYPEPPVSKFVSATFAERDPEVTGFLREMFLGTDLVNELALWMNDHDAEPEEVALHYLQNHQDSWRTWLPEDVADRVAAAVSDT